MNSFDPNNAIELACNDQATLPSFNPERLLSPEHGVGGRSCGQGSEIKEIVLFAQAAEALSKIPARSMDPTIANVLIASGGKD
jgi:hypothetical protein